MFEFLSLVAKLVRDEPFGGLDYTRVTGNVRVRAVTDPRYFPFIVKAAMVTAVA